MSNIESAIIPSVRITSTWRLALLWITASAVAVPLGVFRAAGGVRRGDGRFAQHNAEFAALSGPLPADHGEGVARGGFRWQSRARGGDAVRHADATCRSDVPAQSGLVHEHAAGPLGV